MIARAVEHVRPRRHLGQRARRASGSCRPVRVVDSGGLGSSLPRQPVAHDAGVPRGAAGHARTQVGPHRQLLVGRGHSIDAVTPRPYTAYKGAIDSFTKTLGVEFAGDNIRVNCVAVDKTRSYQVNFYDMPEEYDRHVPIWVPAGRYGEGDDVAAVVLFLSSEMAAWVVGQTIVADGGTLAAGGWYRTPVKWTNSPLLVQYFEDDPSINARATTRRAVTRPRPIATDRCSSASTCPSLRRASRRGSCATSRAGPKSSASSKCGWASTSCCSTNRSTAIPGPTSGDAFFPATLAIPDPLVAHAFIAAATDRIRLAHRRDVVTATPPRLHGQTHRHARLALGRPPRRRASASAGPAKSSRRVACRSNIVAGAATSASRSCGRSGLRTCPTHSGEFYDLAPCRQYPKPVQLPHPPLWIGGYSAAACRRVARYGDGWYGFDHTAAGGRRLRAATRARVETHTSDRSTTSPSCAAPTTCMPDRSIRRWSPTRMPGVEQFVLSLRSYRSRRDG